MIQSSSTKRDTNKNRRSVKKYIRFERELLSEIEVAMANSDDFSSWVKRACRERLLVESAVSKLFVENECCQLIQRLHIRGFSNKRIARELNVLGFSSPKGKKWTAENIAYFLN